MISEWIICPICGNKTRDRVMEDSRHACGLVLDNGMELLLHIGICRISKSRFWEIQECVSLWF